MQFGHPPFWLLHPCCQCSAKHVSKVFEQGWLQIKSQKKIKYQYILFFIKKGTVSPMATKLNTTAKPSNPLYMQSMYKIDLYLLTNSGIPGSGEDKAVWSVGKRCHWQFLSRRGTFLSWNRASVYDIVDWVCSYKI